MSIGEIFRVLGRRWYIMVTLTLLSLLAGAYQYRAVPLTFESQSSLSLLNSREAAKRAPSYGNPIADAGGSLIVTADVLIRALESPDAARDLRERGVHYPYTVGFAEKADGPVFTLAVTGPKRGEVKRQTEIFTDFAVERMRALQARAEVPPDFRVRAAPIVLPQTPASQPKSRYQSVASVVIFGTGCAFVLSFLAEALASSRRRRAALAAGTEAGAGAGAGAGPGPGHRHRRRSGGRGPRGLLGRRPDATAILTGYLALALFIPSNLALPGLGGVGTPANALALLGLFWYVAGWLAGHVVPAAGTRAPRIAICVLAVSVLAAYIANARRGGVPADVTGADRGLVLLLVWVALVVLASAAIQERQRLDVLMRRLVVMGAMVAVLGVYDFVTDTNIADSITVPGLNTSVASISAMDRGEFTRPRSTTAHPLEFSGMLALLLPFAVQQAFDPVRRHVSGLRRWLPVVLLGGALPLTVSRTSIIGIAIVVLIMVPRWKPQRRWVAIGVLVCSVAVFRVLVPGLIGTITNLFAGVLSEGDSSTQARTIKYAEIVPFFLRDPLFGRGFGTFTPDRFFFTDNQYLLFLAELGILGVLALLVLCFAGIHCGGVIRRLARTEADRELGQAFFAAAVVALAISGTFDALSFPMFAGVFFLTLGAGGSYVGFARRAAREAAAATADDAADPPRTPAPAAVPLPAADRPRLVEA